MSEHNLDSAWEYAENYYKNPEVIANFKRLAKYRPEVFAGYIDFRKAVFNTGEDAALSPKHKELIILAIEIARCKVNPPPVGHARRAVEAGASMAEIAEVVSLCIMIGGMLTFQDAGRFVLEAAEARHEELADE